MKILETVYSKVNDIAPGKLHGNEYIHITLNSFYKLADKKESLLSQKNYEQLFMVGLFSINIPENYQGMGGSYYDCCNVISAAAYEDPEFALCLVYHFAAVEMLSKYMSDTEKTCFFQNLDSDYRFLSFSLHQQEESFVFINKFVNSFFFIPNKNNEAETVLSVYREVVCFEKYDNPAGLSNINLIKVSPVNTGNYGTDKKYPVKCGFESFVRELNAYINTGLSALSAGLSAKLLNLTGEYTNNRVLFKKKLFQYPLIQEKIADMHAFLYGMKAHLYFSQVLTEKRDANLCEYAGFMKYFCSEKLFFIADECMNIHGANGYMEDSGIPNLWKSARSIAFLGSPNDVLAKSYAMELQDGAVYKVMGKPLMAAVTGELSEIYEALLKLENAFSQCCPDIAGRSEEIRIMRIKENAENIILIRLLLNFNIFSINFKHSKDNSNMCCDILLFLIRKSNIDKEFII